MTDEECCGMGEPNCNQMRCPKVVERPRDIYIGASSYATFNEPEPGEWKCEALGLGGWLVLTPPKGKHPNAFWRVMQYLLVGNKWSRVNHND
jgi:hypothetical protein